ncbi:hypothetical protein AAIA72_11095 [Hahella sp. SMD15-11]|uniref:Alginate export domain-containing protein n=1 Tax=Thermohahella caldifontis TaxID=3142973 RepID=A0AB39USP4_9GAMM
MKTGYRIIGWLLAAHLTAGAQASEWRGHIGAEMRLFTQDAAWPDQEDRQYSVYGEPEWYTSWNNRTDSLTVRPFLRVDSADSERTHADIRELLWLHAERDWEIRAGVSKVFWGVTESAHLVDVINQTDLVEAPDGEDKLGQPMIQGTLIRDWGILSGFILPGFRERTFAGSDGRLRPALPVDTDDARYESGAKDRHVDLALRWSHTLGDWDLGVAAFRGTQREPELQLAGTFSNPRLVPYYPQMTQLSLDAQATLGDWLWKVEMLGRDSTEKHFASVAGFEYTRVGIMETDQDLGLLVEYQFDDRGDDSGVIGQNDLFLGARWTFNDAEGTEILAGMTQDLDRSGDRTFALEASARLDNHWKWFVNAWFFSADSGASPTWSVRRDDFIQLSMERYF